MEVLDMNAHLQYLNTFVTGVRETRGEIGWNRLIEGKGSSQDAERKLQEVNYCVAVHHGPA